jgi:hypothetical protein
LSPDALFQAPTIAALAESATLHGKTPASSKRSLARLETDDNPVPEHFPEARVTRRDLETILQRIDRGPRS